MIEELVKITIFDKMTATQKRRFYEKFTLQSGLKIIVKIICIRSLTDK